VKTERNNQQFSYLGGRKQATPRVWSS